MEIFFENIDLKWAIPTVLAIISVIYTVVGHRKRLSASVDKEVYDLVKELIEEINASVLYFAHIEISESSVGIRRWGGNLYEIGNIKKHISDDAYIYTSPELVYKHEFVYRSSSSIIPIRIAKALLKLQDWNISPAKGKNLKNYIVAGTKADIPNTSDVRRIYLSAPMEVVSKELFEKENKHDMMFTVKYNGTFEDYRKNCKAVSKEIKRWLKRKNIKDINRLIFEQKIDSMLCV